MVATQILCNEIKQPSSRGFTILVMFCFFCYIGTAQVWAEVDEVSQLFEEFINGEDEARQSAEKALLSRQADSTRIAGMAFVVAERRSELVDVRVAAFWLWQKTQQHTIDSIGICEQILRRRSEPLPVRLSASTSIALIAKTVKDRQAAERAFLQVLADDTEAPEVRCQVLAHLAILGRCSSATQRAISKLCNDSSVVAELRMMIVDFVKVLPSQQPELTDFCLRSLLSISEGQSSTTVRVTAANAVIGVSAVAQLTPEFEKIVERWRRLAKDMSVDKRVRESASVAADLLDQTAKMRTK